MYTHFTIGFYIPKKNAITFDKKAPLLLYYLLWIYNLVYSSLQIRDGYPQAPFKPPFIKDTSALTVNLFRIYKSTPFLWEMKVITDWIVTTTSLDLFQWFKLDDAFCYLYQCNYQNAGRLNRPKFSAIGTF